MLLTYFDVSVYYQISTLIHHLGVRRMNAFIGLVKKDMTLMKFWYIAWLIFTAISIIGGYLIVNWLSEPNLLVPIYLMLLGLHLFLAPIMLLSALRQEGKTQLWLYNPQSSKKLLLSKVSAVFIIQVISQVLMALYGILVMAYLMYKGEINTLSELFTFSPGLLIHLGILSVSLYLSFWITFLWTVYHSLGNYPAIRNFRWLIVILVWGTFNVIEATLIKIKIIREHLVSFTVNINAGPNMEYDMGNGWNISYTEMPVPITPIILYAIVSIILFFIASRLLDRKVEV